MPRKQNQLGGWLRLICLTAVVGGFSVATLDAWAVQAATTPEQMDAAEHAGVPGGLPQSPYAATRARLARLGFVPVKIVPKTCATDASPLVCINGSARSCRMGANACYFYWLRKADNRLLVVETFNLTGDTVIDAWWVRRDDLCGYVTPKGLTLKTLPAARPGEACG